MILGSLMTPKQINALWVMNCWGRSSNLNLTSPESNWRSRSAESHIVCGILSTMFKWRIACLCQRQDYWDFHDGCFAEYINAKCHGNQLKENPSRNHWIQEPFGNAVHACQATDLRGKPVVVIGCGTIGLFVILIARAIGASMVIESRWIHTMLMVNNWGVMLLLIPGAPSSTPHTLAIQISYENSGPQMDLA